MTASVIPSLPTVLHLPADVPYAYKEQPALGGLIPDVLVAVGASTKVFTDGYKPTVTEASLIGYVENREGVILDEICRDLFMHMTTARELVTNLLNRGYLTLRDEKYIISSAVSSSGIHLLAIEIKLQLWRKALAQATSYLRFVERAAVVLDGNRIKKPEILVPEFESAGVGLWILHGPIIDEVVPAKQMAPLPSSRYTALLPFFA